MFEKKEETINGIKEFGGLIKENLSYVLIMVIFSLIIALTINKSMYEKSLEDFAKENEEGVKIQKIIDLEYNKSIEVRDKFIGNKKFLEDCESGADKNEQELNKLVQQLSEIKVQKNILVNKKYNEETITNTGSVNITNK